MQDVLGDMILHDFSYSILMGAARETFDHTARFIFT